MSVEFNFDYSVISTGREVSGGMEIVCARNWQYAATLFATKFGNTSDFKIDICDNGEIGGGQFKVSNRFGNFTIKFTFNAC